MDNSKNIYDLLSGIQQKLKAPKNQVNKFGGYKYRSCEDIMEAVKPLLNGLCLVVSDKIVSIGDRYYVKATAKLLYGNSNIKVSAFAREPLEKKGMDVSQITGSSSSYARKYALNGLFAIDDTKDADTQSPDESEQTTVSRPATQKQREVIISLSKKLGHTEEEAKNIVVTYFKLANFAQLSLTQASQTIEKLTKRVEEQKQQEEGLDEEAMDEIDQTLS